MTQSPAPAPAFSYSFMLIFASFYFLLYKKKTHVSSTGAEDAAFFFHFLSCEVEKRLVGFFFSFNGIG